jgi:hypothetical protein
MSIEVKLGMVFYKPVVSGRGTLVEQDSLKSLWVVFTAFHFICNLRVALVS